MCKKKKTVFRIKGLILQSNLTTVMGLIPSASHLMYNTTYRDKKEEIHLTRGKKAMSPNFHKYGHIEIRDTDESLMRQIYLSVAPYLVQDYTHDFA